MTELAVGPRSSSRRGRLRSEFREQSASFSATHEAVVATIHVAIASAFRNAGCHVTEASTPLEAIAHIASYLQPRSRPASPINAPQRIRCLRNANNSARALWPVANSLHFETSMPAMRDVVLTAIGIAWVVVLVPRMLRRATARKLTEARRLVSRRVVDEEARADLRARVAREGGAMLGRSDAHGTSHANPMIELLPR